MVYCPSVSSQYSGVTELEHKENTQRKNKQFGQRCKDSALQQPKAGIK